jgi:N-acetylneuraminate lyase
MPNRLEGVVPAVFTPMHEDGSLNLVRVGPIVEHLRNDGVSGLYVCGGTGEGASLTTDERMATAEAYVNTSDRTLPVIVHVGHNSLAEARKLAAHAQEIGADGISAMPPSVYTIDSVGQLVLCLTEIASAAPKLPFYYYHIPSLTGVDFDMVEVLRQCADRIPNLAGAKYSKPTVHEFQECLELRDRRLTIMFGCDEMLLSALAVGASAAVGSTYNFATPLYLRVMDAFARGDLEEAQRYQSYSVRMARVLYRYRGIPAFKASMRLIDVDCGPTRLPLVALTPSESEDLQKELDEIGFFEWGRS